MLSKNCSKYTDRTSIVVTGEASVAGGGPNCRVQLAPVFSCQKKGLDLPDAPTEEMMRETAHRDLNRKGCAILPDPSELDLSFRTAHVGGHVEEYSAEELIQKGTVSNCSKVGNDPNDVHFRATLQGYPAGKMKTADGREVTSHHMKLSANLYACDVSDSAMEGVERDLRKVAAYNLLHTRGLTIDPDDIEVPHLSVLPIT